MLPISFGIESRICLVRSVASKTLRLVLAGEEGNKKGSSRSPTGAAMFVIIFL